MKQNFKALLTIAITDDLRHGIVGTYYGRLRSNYESVYRFKVLRT